MSPAQTRHLVLLRHAKSARPHGVPDHERPLAGKGRRNAQAAAEWFVREGPDLDVVLCSDAVRARQTWEIVRTALPRPPPSVHVPLLYGASAEDVLDIVRRAPATARTVMVVGHEPSMSGTALLLSGNGSDVPALRRLAEKFPTSGVAVLRLSGSWGDAAPGTAALEAFAVPRV
jgi:phosphohistidine phosphatase